MISMQADGSENNNNFSNEIEKQSNLSEKLKKKIKIKVYSIHKLDFDRTQTIYPCFLVYSHYQFFFFW